MADDAPISAEPSTAAETPHHRGRTIGILISWFGDGYTGSIVSGVVDRAGDDGLNVICFAGGPPSLEPHDGVGTIYRLAGSANVDGLIMATGTLAVDATAECLERLAAGYGDIPVVSIAVALPGCSRVVVESKQALTDLFEHLIGEHGYRRIGFIRGPTSNAEANDRYQTYLQALQTHHVASDPSLVVSGDFRESSGGAAIAPWLEARQPLPDVIAAANDEMAIGAMDAFRARGIRVPEDVAIVGFDDIELAGSLFASLTTVRQPIYELGSGATRLLLARMQRQEAPEEVALPGAPMIRESCGCSRRLSLDAATTGSATSDRASLLRDLIGVQFPI